jgi:hypothetical protein
MSYRVYTVPSRMNYVDYDSLAECSITLCEVTPLAAGSL